MGGAVEGTWGCWTSTLRLRFCTAQHHPCSRPILGDQGASSSSLSERAPKSLLNGFRRTTPALWEMHLRKGGGISEWMAGAKPPKAEKGMPSPPSFPKLLRAECTSPHRSLPNKLSANKLSAYELSANRLSASLRIGLTGSSSRCFNATRRVPHKQPPRS